MGASELPTLLALRPINLRVTAHPPQSLRALFHLPASLYFQSAAPKHPFSVNCIRDPKEGGSYATAGSCNCAHALSTTRQLTTHPNNRPRPSMTTVVQVRRPLEALSMTNHSESRRKSKRIAGTFLIGEYANPERPGGGRKDGKWGMEMENWRW